MKLKRTPWIVMPIVLAVGFFTTSFLYGICSPFSLTPAPGIVLGSDVIRENLFYKQHGWHAVTSISFGRFLSGSEDEIAVVGENGAVVLTYAGTERACIPFDRRGGKTIPVKVHSDGVYGFMNRGGGWQPVSLLDSKGNTRWKYPSDGRPAADTMSAGDLNGDGELEFVVGMNGSGGLRVLGSKGNLMHRYEAGNVFSVEVLDIDNDGAPEILHSDSGKGIVMRRANGDAFGVIKNSDGHFSLLQPSKLYAQPIIVYIKHNHLNLIDIKGAIVKTFKFPGWGHSFAEGTVAYLKGPEAPPYFAFVRTIGAKIHRSVVVIFDSSGRLIYQEIMPEPHLAIAAFWTQGQDREKLLVGEGSNVWEYSLNPDVGSNLQ